MEEWLLGTAVAVSSYALTYGFNLYNSIAKQSQKKLKNKPQSPTSSSTPPIKPHPEKAADTSEILTDDSDVYDITADIRNHSYTCQNIVLPRRQHFPSGGKLVANSRQNRPSQLATQKKRHHSSCSHSPNNTILSPRINLSKKQRVHNTSFQRYLSSQVSNAKKRKPIYAKSVVEDVSLSKKSRGRLDDLRNIAGSSEPPPSICSIQEVDESLSSLSTTPSSSTTSSPPKNPSPITSLSTPKTSIPLPRKSLSTHRYSSHNLHSIDRKRSTVNGYLIDRYHERKLHKKSIPQRSQSFSFSPSTKNSPFQKSFIKFKHKNNENFIETKCLDISKKQITAKTSEVQVRNDEIFDDAWLTEIQNKYQKSTTDVYSPLFSPRSELEIERLKVKTIEKKKAEQIEKTPEKTIEHTNSTPHPVETSTAETETVNKDPMPEKMPASSTITICPTLPGLRKSVTINEGINQIKEITKDASTGSVVQNNDDRTNVVQVPQSTPIKENLPESKITNISISPITKPKSRGKILPKTQFQRIPQSPLVSNPSIQNSTLEMTPVSSPVVGTKQFEKLPMSTPVKNSSGSTFSTPVTCSNTASIYSPSSMGTPSSGSFFGSPIVTSSAVSQGSSGASPMNRKPLRRRRK